MAGLLDPEDELNRYYLNALASGGKEPATGADFTSTTGPLSIAAMNTPEGRTASVGVGQQLGPVQLRGNAQFEPRQGGGVEVTPGIEAMINAGPVNVGGGANWTNAPTQAGAMARQLQPYLAANANLDISDQLKLAISGQLGPDVQRRLLAELQLRFGDKADTNLTGSISHRDLGGRGDTTFRVGGGWRF